MRKLTVKNFSVIKEAELEFGKITVLIGPQSSGKSLLCKLAFFFVQVVPEIASGMLLQRMPVDQFLSIVRQDFLEHFTADQILNDTAQDSHISYISDEYQFNIHSNKSDRTWTFDLGALPDRYNQWIDSHMEEGSARKQISAIRNGDKITDFPVQLAGSKYIPTGRAFFSTPNKGFASFAGKNLDWITQRFSTEMDFNYQALIESSNTKNLLLSEFGRSVQDILGGRVVSLNGIAHFRRHSDMRWLPFELLSSGTLELLPLLNPLSQIVSNIKPSDADAYYELQYGPFFVEEPESSVFPKTQYDLVRLFTWLTNERLLNISLAITTHSPYTLSSFNNLIYAGQLATQKPELKEEIVKMVPERFWIQDGSFRAYCIHDGVLKSILSESGLIDGEYLDSVSDTIGNEFDSLLRLEYDHTEAS